MQVRLVSHGAGQHRGARNPVQLPALEQKTGRFTRLAPKNKPIPSALCPIAVHHRAG